jgi:hypothetical protein
MKGEESGMRSRVRDVQSGKGILFGNGKYSWGWKIQLEMGNTVGDGKYNRGWEIQWGREIQSGMGKISPVEVSNA